MGHYPVPSPNGVPGMPGPCGPCGPGGPCGMRPKMMATRWQLAVKQTAKWRLDHAGLLGMLKLNPQLYKAQLFVYVSLFAMVLSFFHGVAWFPSLYFSKDLSNTLPDTEIHNRFSAESLPLKFDAVQIFSGHTSNPRIHVSANAKAALGRASRLQRARRAKQPKQPGSSQELHLF